jgi:hypothetical protein
MIKHVRPNPDGAPHLQFTIVMIMIIIIIIVEIKCTTSLSVLSAAVAHALYFSLTQGNAQGPCMEPKCIVP